jgi:hypothetical protein
MKNLAVFGCLVFFVFFYGCHATGGGAHIDWGEDKVASSPSGHGNKAKGGPPPHAPAHGYRAKHTYRYYPCERVYSILEEECIFTWKEAVGGCLCPYPAPCESSLETM